MSLSAEVLNLLARNRFSIPIACGGVALFIFVYQRELDPPPATSIELIEVEASALGTLQVNVMGRRNNVAVAQRDAGYAIEYSPRQPAPGTGLLGPVRRTFASELELTAAELRWIKGHGPSYRIGLIRDQVVSIASLTQPLIEYERYMRVAAGKRDLWRLYGVLVLTLGAALYALGRHRHLRADA